MENEKKMKYEVPEVIGFEWMNSIGTCFSNGSADTGRCSGNGLTANYTCAGNGNTALTQCQAQGSGFTGGT